MSTSEDAAQPPQALVTTACCNLLTDGSLESGGGAWTLTNASVVRAPYIAARDMVLQFAPAGGSAEQAITLPVLQGQPVAPILELDFRRVDTTKAGTLGVYVVPAGSGGAASARRTLGGATSRRKARCVYPCCTGRPWLPGAMSC